MRELQSSYPLTPEPQPLRSMFLLFGFIMLGMTVGALAAALVVGAGALASGGTIKSVTELLQHPSATPNGWWWLMLVQSLSHVCTFLLPSLVYWFTVDKRRLADFNGQAISQVAGLVLVVFLTTAFMPVNGLIIELNQSLKLPESLAPLERWMRAKEDEMAELTKFLTTFQTVPQLLMAILTIGLLPAIGEEVLFRGILQRKFIVWTGNIHVGIWLSAALFSAIHFQFYGFFPRMLLGAMFGYLYVWSGNIWVPILAHFVNNGLQVLLIFLYQRQLTTIDVDSTESVPLPAAFFGAVVSVGALLLFKRMNKTGNSYS
ncbi:CPBP family intramembrane glutamic endopeptidase [Fibrella forsythiae]|uniref:CPBP family intramembrane metalloprotease n=1 Tax=Fibrella forsythiae TaxID=2817061 RepID=A0ABS3JQN7_9BACT|nr:CPBP family intramembrane glutamic endopeptidase [Fibrella forsythiae]MBO0952329.1 CPBP family intramembrane metalloprotease [Fibrella forsythiae]